MRFGVGLLCLQFTIKKTFIMSQVYLKDGTIADLVDKTAQGFLVNPYNVYYGYEGEEDAAPSGNLKMVQEVFDKAPIALIDADYKSILDLYDAKQVEVNELCKKVTEIKREVAKLEATKTDFTKCIFNRSELKNAKRFIVFKKDSIVPLVMDNKNQLKLSINYEISNYTVEEKVWVSKVSFDCWSSSDFFDNKYGIFIDLTDEEILSKCLERQKEIGVVKFNDHYIKGTPDSWLTPEFLEKKRSILLSEILTKKEKLTTDIGKLQKELSELPEK